MRNAVFIAAIFSVIFTFSCAPHQGGDGLPEVSDYPIVTNTGPSYYVDSQSGNDSNDGLSQGAPWQSIGHLNSQTLSPGSSVYFKRGSVWRERVQVQSGTPQGFILYGAYGTGPLPVFLGSVSMTNAGDWTNITGQPSEWVSTQTFSFDVGNIIFNDGESCGLKKWSTADLTSNGEYTFYSNTRQVVLFYTGNPASAGYTNIDLALNQHMFYVGAPLENRGLQGVSNIIFENLALKYGAAHGFGFKNAQHVVVRGCEISWMGGGLLHMDGATPVRFGNAIEFFNSDAYCEVYGNKIWEIYDTAITPQNSTGIVLLKHIFMHHNIMWNCGLASIELWCRSSGSLVTNIRFENNTCVDAGMGWGRQRPDPGGYQVLMASTYADTGSIFFRNNIFSGASRSMLVVSQNFNNFSQAVLDYNLWYSPTNTILYTLYTDPNAIIVTTVYSTNTNGFKSATAKETHGIFIDPLLNGDFTLQSGSPAIDAGVDNGYTRDFNGQIVPNGGFDLGALEF